MKSISVFLTVILSAGMALAYPAVGDKARFITTDSMIGTYEHVKEIIDYRPTSATEGVYWVQNTDYLPHGENIYMETMASYSMITSDVAEKYLKYCGGMNGIYVTVTVPAGTFKTCKLTLSSADYVNEIYIANVPFGWVKMEYNSLTGHGSFSSVMKTYEP